MGTHEGRTARKKRDHYICLVGEGASRAVFRRCNIHKERRVWRLRKDLTRGSLRSRKPQLCKTLESEVMFEQWIGSAI